MFIDFAAMFFLLFFVVGTLNFQTVRDRRPSSILEVSVSCFSVYMFVITQVGSCLLAESKRNVLWKAVIYFVSSAQYHGQVSLSPSIRLVGVSPPTPALDFLDNSFGFAVNRRAILFFEGDTGPCCNGVRRWLESKYLRTKSPH